MLAAHPYEEPAYDVSSSPRSPTRPGARAGSVGCPRTDDAARVRRRGSRDALPETAHGVRVAGDPDAAGRTPSRCAAGRVTSSSTGRARQGADVYVTSDLRHHPASELREHADGPALVDVAHWAAEWTWLPVLRDRLVGGSWAIRWRCT